MTLTNERENELLSRMSEIKTSECSGGPQAGCCEFCNSVCMLYNLDGESLNEEEYDFVYNKQSISISDEWAEIENRDEVKQFVAKHSDLLFGDELNGDTEDTAIEILSQIYHNTQHGCTAGDSDLLDHPFFYSHNGDNQAIEFFTVNELCNLMGIKPEVPEGY